MLGLPQQLGVAGRAANARQKPGDVGQERPADLLALNRHRVQPLLVVGHGVRVPRIDEVGEVREHRVEQGDRRIQVGVGEDQRERVVEPALVQLEPAAEALQVGFARRRPRMGAQVGAHEQVIGRPGVAARRIGRPPEVHRRLDLPARAQQVQRPHAVGVQLPLLGVPGLLDHAAADPQLAIESRARRDAGIPRRCAPGRPRHRLTVPSHPLDHVAERHVRQFVPEHRGHVGARAPGLHRRVVRRIDLGEVGGIPEQPHVHQHEAAGKRRRVDGRVVDDRGVDLQAGERRRAPQPLDDQADESVPIRIIDAAVRRHHGITERLAAGAGVGGRQL